MTAVRSLYSCFQAFCSRLTPEPQNMPHYSIPHTRICYNDRSMAIPAPGAE